MTSDPKGTFRSFALLLSQQQMKKAMAKPVKVTVCSTHLSIKESLAVWSL